MELGQERHITYKDTIKQDAAASMDFELSKLMKDSEGFKELFTKYLALDGKENVVWEQIGKPSNDLVSRHTS